METSIDQDEFSALDQAEQIDRLLALGRRALEVFGVELVGVETLVHAENTTFRIESPQGIFNLRISRPGYQSTANIRSELMFLSALRESGLHVPKPYIDEVVTAEAPGVPEPRDCVLLHWMNGEFKKGVRPRAESGLIGRTMAQMHEFSIGWDAPEDFDRQQLHGWAFGEERKAMAFDLPSEAVFEEDRLLLVEVDREARELLRELPRTSETFGLIHSDMHANNILFEDDHLNVIDFDDTGWGFWYYDFAAALAYAFEIDGFAEMQDAFFEGYATVRPVPPRAVELQNPFMRLRLAGICNWMISRQDNPHFRENGRAYVQRMCDKIRALGG